MSKLEGKVALIAGSAHGIGEAIARMFAAEGASVVCADIDAEQARRVAAEIEREGGRAASCECDVADSASAKGAAEMAPGTFGRLDVVVSNAAVISPSVPLGELAEADWDRAIAVNLTGSFLVCKYAIPHLLAAGAGSIVLTASQMARVVSRNSAVYCTTKGALLQLAKGIAVDYAEQGIRANTLSPGGIATRRMLARFPDMDEAQRVWGARHPVGRLGEPEEIARAAVFLASDDSAFMTGADLLVDGGYSAV